MLKHTLVSAVCVSVTALAINAHAVELGKPIKVVVNRTNNGLTAAQPQEYLLLNIQLNSEQKRVLNSYKPTASKKRTDLPAKAELGMNDVPVLDQGRHGTCVTFAESAAIDAVLGRGDYVSPLCSLELGDTLSNYGYYPSGWDGSFGPWVLSQYLRFGAVSTDDQRMKSCAGTTEYPGKDERQTGSPMSLDDYKAMSEDLNPYLYVNYLMNFDERFESKFVEDGKVEKVFNEVKEALSKGNRVTFGTFLVIPPTLSCTVGACATHNTARDTWALTSELDDPGAFTGGHEMVITGYDDDAVATDNQGNKHQGLFTLRNSWSDKVGDKGNFYMTYDYFKKYAGEAQAIVQR